MPVNDEAARYREAARLTLEQLDWCVVYLHGINKTKIARSLAENRFAIMRRLADPERES